MGIARCFSDSLPRLPPIGIPLLAWKGFPLLGRTRHMMHVAEVEVTVGPTPEEFTALVADHRARVFGFLIQMVGNRDDAMDLLQDGFLTLHTKWHLRDPDRPITPWLYKIFRNLAIDHLRRRGRKHAFQLDAQSHPLASRRAARPLLKIQLWRAVNELPDEQREAFLLRELHGLSYAEIGEVTGTSNTTVTTRLHHARQRLRKELRGYL